MPFILPGAILKAHPSGGGHTLLETASKERTRQRRLIKTRWKRNWKPRFPSLRRALLRSPSPECGLVFSLRIGDRGSRERGRTGISTAWDIHAFDAAITIPP